MKLCIIGPKDSNETAQIKILAEDRGYECKRVYMPDIYFEISGGEFNVHHRKFELLEFDVFLFRGISKNLSEALLLAKYLSDKGKVIVDDSLARNHYDNLNLYKSFIKNNIPQLNQYQTNSLKAARDILMEISHPILIKSNDNNRKNIVISEEWTDSYDLVRTSKEKKFTFIEYIPARSFYRVFIVGDEVIGGLHKEILDDEPKLDHSIKTKNRVADLSEEIKDVALRASRAAEFEICSVDILPDPTSNYVLNVKRAPRFTKFERVTGIDFVGKMLDYIEKKVKS